jgi:hypothetical protein
MITKMRKENQWIKMVFKLRKAITFTINQIANYILIELALDEKDELLTGSCIISYGSRSEVKRVKLALLSLPYISCGIYVH